MKTCLFCHKWHIDGLFTYGESCSVRTAKTNALTPNILVELHVVTPYIVFISCKFYLYSCIYVQEILKDESIICSLVLELRSQI